MYALSQRLRRKPGYDEDQGQPNNAVPRTVVIETFDNLEDACLALARKQNGRKNTDEFFVEFMRAARRPILANMNKNHL